MRFRRATAMDDGRTDRVPASAGGTRRRLRIGAIGVIALFLNLSLALLPPQVSSFMSDIGVAHFIIPLGELGETLARDHPPEQSMAPADPTATLTIDDWSWSPLLVDLGISYEAAETDDVSVGHESSGYQGEPADARQPSMIPGSLRFDAERFDAYLDHVEDELGRRPVDASVTIDGVDVEIAPARAGWVIDRVAVKMTLLVQIIDRDPVVVELPLRPQPAAVTTERAEATKALIDQALAQPFILKLQDQQWTVPPERLADAVHVDRDGAGTLTASLHPASMHALVIGLAAEIDAGPTDAWVQDLGTHQWLVPSRRGRTLHRAALIESFDSAIASGEHTIDLAVAEKGFPKLTTEELMVEMGITDLIATGDSTFAGSGAGRSHNIVQAAYMIDGTLIPAGGSFSCNNAVGSLFSGEFTEVGSFIDGPLGQSLAGGVCQVSTTVFRAALNAGLPITEWWPHSYRSPFYESGGWSPGFDASIVQDAGSPAQNADFRFENTTDSWLLVRAVTSPDRSLRVELHGADPGYTVEFEEPVVEVTEEAPVTVDVVVGDALPPETVLPLQPATDGLRVTVVRRVFDADGEEISTDSFVSYYRASAAVRRVSPDRD